jgi:hypothetical protein
MKKQTAVEWLVEKMLNQDWYTYKSLEYIQQAKEMENRQLKEMYLKGIENYDPTFKQQEQ